MAKYDWKQLEKEFILSDYKTVSSFLRDKGIDNNAYIRRTTKGWKEKKLQNSHKKVAKIIEKVTEKEIEKETQKILRVKDVANDLLLKIEKSNNELNMHLARNKKKTKTVEYDYKTNKPSKETIQENEEITSYIDIIDRKGLKELTSALKDLNEILTDKQESINKDLENADQILVKIKEVANNGRNS